MKFLVAFVAILGYASASVIGSRILGVNPGDAQAAAIDARAAIRDNAQAWTDAARLNLDINRNINENILWNNVAANQNAIAVAQNQAAVNSAIVTGRLAVAPGVVAPLGLGAPIGLGAINGIGAINGLGAINGINGLGLGLGGLGVGLRGW